MLRIAISFDYDSPAGYRESFHMRDFPANADYQGTQILLDVLSRHDVQASFGIVGQAALPGEPFDHCQEQIRQIYRLGHEVASHSMTHRFIPPMRDTELRDEVVASKNSLEACIGAPIEGFIPPFNRPSHFPRCGAYSIAEFLGLEGRGRGRQSIASMLRILRQAGFGWSRVSFENKWLQLGRRVGLASERPPMQPFIHNDMVAIPLHQTGFGTAASNLIRRWMNSNYILTLYGHPNQALSANGQNAKELDRLLSEFRAQRLDGALKFGTMAEVADLTRNASTESIADASHSRAPRASFKVS